MMDHEDYSGQLWKDRPDRDHKFPRSRKIGFRWQREAEKKETDSRDARLAMRCSMVARKAVQECMNGNGAASVNGNGKHYENGHANGHGALDGIHLSNGHVKLHGRNGHAPAPTNGEDAHAHASIFSGMSKEDWAKMNALVQKQETEEEHWERVADSRHPFMDDTGGFRETHGEDRNGQEEVLYDDSVPHIDREMRRQLATMRTLYHERFI